MRRKGAAAATSEPNTADAAPLRRSQRCAARSRDGPKDTTVSSSSQDNWQPQETVKNRSSVREAKVSVAVRSGLMPQPTQQERSTVNSPGPWANSELSGYWSLLPEELLETILNLCTTPQLGMLETSCTFFRKSGVIERIAKSRLKSVPRARGLKPNRKEGERLLALLHYVNSQSTAAAQATAVACGSHHTMALLVRAEVADSAASSTARDCKHSLYAFGRGFHGQLGLGDHNSSNAPKVASLGFRPCTDNPDLEEETMPAVVACGRSHSASISRRGELFTWGSGFNGELGLGQWTPLEVPRPRQCYAQTRIVSIAAGAHHTLAIAENGSLWSCGRGREGQLGHGIAADTARLQRVQGTLEGIRIVSASAGVNHSMALAADGSLFTWGDGRYGQLGHAQMQPLAAMVPGQVMMSMPQKIQRLDPGPLAPEARVTAIAAGAYHSMALTVGGSLLAFGKNSSGQLGTGDLENKWKPTKVEVHGEGPYDGKNKRAIQVSCGATHTVALIMNHGTLEVRATGGNTWGQLGQGDRKDRMYFCRTVTYMQGVVAVQCGDEHSAAITGTGHLYVWGRGDSGQLGLGDERCRWKPTLLKSFRVVHPEKTLRRNKRSLPVTRPVEPAVKRQRVADAWHYV